MFFDQLDERNAMVKSILTFEKVGQVGLADLAWLDRASKKLFPSSELQMRGSKYSFLAIMMIEI